MSNEVVIYTTTFNSRLEWLRDLLGAIRRFSAMPYDMLVVDNGTTDGTKKFLAGLEWVRVIRNEQNLGCSRGGNCALREAVRRRDTKYVVNIDTDALITGAGWLEKAFSFMEKHSEVGLAGDVWSPGWKLGNASLRFVKDDWLSALSEEEKQELPHVQGGFWVIRRQMIDEIGLYDESFSHDFMDIEYSIRALSYGWQLGKLEFVWSKCWEPTRTDLKKEFLVWHKVVTPQLRERMTRASLVLGGHFGDERCRMR